MGDRRVPLALLALGTGVSGCGDGGLQTAEVVRSLRDAGYADPRVTTWAELAKRTPGLSNIIPPGERTVVDVIVVTRLTDDDPYVVARVSVDIDSGTGVKRGDSSPIVSTFTGDKIRDAAGAGTFPSGFLPAGIDLQRARFAEVCNVVVIAFESDQEPDDRFDRVLEILAARC